MLKIEKNQHGLEMIIDGAAIDIVSELSLLTHMVQEAVGNKMDVYKSINDPISKSLAAAYMKAKNGKS